METKSQTKTTQKPRPKESQNSAEKESALTSDEVRAIIKSCATYGVLELKFKGLEISLNPKVSEAESPKKASGNVPRETSNNPVNEITEQEHEHQNQDTLEVDEMRLKEEQLAMAFIENPSLAEEMIRNGDLDDFESDDEQFDE